MGQGVGLVAVLLACYLILCTAERGLACAPTFRVLLVNINNTEHQEELTRVQ